MLYNITSTDDEAGANIALGKKRAILPKVYCENKKKRARDINMSGVAFGQEHFSESENEDEGKTEMRLLFHAKVREMDNMFIDLTAEEIENIQDMLGENSDEIEYGDPDILSIYPNKPPNTVPMSSKLEPLSDEQDVDANTQFDGPDNSSDQLSTMHTNIEIESSYDLEFVSTEQQQCQT